MAAIRPILARCPPVKGAYHWLCDTALSGVCRVSPVLLGRLRYRAAWGRWPDLEHPRTFDEKLLWLNFYWRHPLKTEYADKYALRQHVERQGLGHLLPRLYGVYRSADAIDLAALPEQFVLKCTHGAKCNVFCRNKDTLDLTRARRDLARWLATDYSTLLGELQYAGMTPRIICEEFLEDGSGELPRDYKLYCFGGRVHCTLICSGRRANDNATYDYRDRSWQHLPYDRESGAEERPVTRPAGYEEMVSAAERLSKPFPFVRVDFYSIRGRAVLGEMTFTPSACIDTTYTELATRVLGDLIELPPALEHPERR